MSTGLDNISVSTSWRIVKRGDEPTGSYLMCEEFHTKAVFAFGVSNQTKNGRDFLANVKEGSVVDVMLIAKGIR